MERGYPVAHIVLINDVIMDEKKRVNKLNAHGCREQLVLFRPSGTQITIVHKSRPQTLSASQHKSLSIAECVRDKNIFLARL